MSKYVEEGEEERVRGGEGKNGGQREKKRKKDMK